METALLTSHLRVASPARRERLAGVQAMLPLLAGLVPFGMVVGTAIASSPVPAAGWAGTWLVYGGSAHLAVLHAGHGWAATGWAVAAAVLVNTRLVVYGVAMGRHWRGESTAFKAVMAATLVDPSFAVGDVRYEQPGPAADKRAFYVGAALTLWCGWMAAIVAGMWMGDVVGDRAVLELAVPVCIAALLARSVQRTRAHVAVLVAVAVAAAGSAWPAGSGLLAAIVAGGIAGAVSERRSS